MASPRAILAEDEPLLREELAELLASLWPDLEIVAQAADGIATLQALEKHAADILFLDINMPGLNGLEVARQASGRCHVVFVTAYDQHTLAAFEQGAVDYLLKPVQPGRLATTVARLKERIGRPPAVLVWDAPNRTLIAANLVGTMPWTQQPDLGIDRKERG